MYSTHGCVSVPHNPWDAFQCPETAEVKSLVIGRQPAHGKATLLTRFSVILEPEIPPSTLNTYAEVSADPCLSDAILNLRSGDSVLNLRIQEQL